MFYYMPNNHVCYTKKVIEVNKSYMSRLCPDCEGIINGWNIYWHAGVHSEPRRNGMHLHRGQREGEKKSHLHWKPLSYY